MSSTQSNGNEKVPSTTEPYRVSFSAGLKSAETLMKLKDWEGAIDLLSNLQAEYVKSVRVFDLMGDVLLKQGNTKEGVRFKTLHEVLRGTFKIVEEETSYADVSTADKDSVDSVKVSQVVIDRPTDEASDYFPLTESVAKECMRQGHFDKGVAVLTKLLRERPGDKALETALEEAREKQRGKQLLKIFQQWLKNIEEMKSGRAAGA